MKRAIICCGIIYQDIEDVLKSLPYEADIIQLPPKLHNHPDQLTSQLQEETKAQYNGVNVSRRTHPRILEQTTQER